MDKTATMSIGIVVERRKSDSRWIDAVWKPVSVFTGAPVDAGWRELRSGEGWTWFHAATVPLELHRTDAESYKYNLSTRSPSVFVVMEPDTGEFPWRVVLATVSAYEGESYLTGDEAIVEAVPMPEDVAAWLHDFALAHFKPEPFRKRRRDKSPVMEADKFGKEPVFGRRTGSPEPDDE